MSSNDNFLVGGSAENVELAPLITLSEEQIYTGEGDDRFKIDEFFRLLDVFFFTSQVTSNTVQVNSLIRNTKKSALNWIHEYVSEARGKRHSIQYRQLVADMRAAFIRKQDAYYLTSALWNLRQTGTLTDYSNKFEQLKDLVSCMIQIEESLFINCFILGLRDEIRDEIEEEAHTFRTFEDVVKRADVIDMYKSRTAKNTLEFETVEPSVREYGKSQHDKVTQRFRKNNNRNAKGYRIPASQYREASRLNVCTECLKYGHRLRDCRTYKSKKLLLRKQNSLRHEESSYR